MKGNGTSSRRDFLLATSLGAAAIVAVVGTEHRKSGTADEIAPEHLQGYRASPHVMKYYQTTRV